MNNRELKTIIKLFENSTLASMKLERDDVTIELQKPKHSCSAHPHQDRVPVSSSVGEATLTHKDSEEKTADYYPIKAPLVGTFFEAGGPDQPPFVKENQMVKKGETVCIIEAMKVMNEITAPQDGKVMKIHMNNGESVMVEQVLMEIV
jgi:acetyl-CoA carboxylase biotin carboxyl carrier protein